MDRLYKTATTSTNKCTAGAYAKLVFTLTANPDDNDTLKINWNNVTRTYTFSTSGGINTQIFSPPASYTCQIGSTVQETVANLQTTIHSNVHDTTLGEDTTISSSVSGNVITIYSNAKISNNINTTGSTIVGSKFTSVPTTGTTAQAEPGAPYTGVWFSGPCTLLVRNDVEGAYNAGPPVNGLKTINVALPNTVVPMEVWGINKANATLFK